MRKILLAFMLIGGLMSIYAQPDLIEGIITRETFGETNWDTDGPSSNGHPTHWDWDDVTSWTSWNGHIEGGYDSSVRIQTYMDGGVRPEYWREPSTETVLHMAIRTGDTYFGSWDTSYYVGIDISEATPITAIEFGYGRIRTTVDGDTAHRSLNVMYRVDGGAWVQADTSLIIPENTFRRWDYVVMPVDLTGSTLDIMFACLQTNEQIYLDDITVIGMVPAIPLMEDYITRETFGESNWEKAIKFSKIF